MFRQKIFRLAVPDLSSQLSETDVFFVDPHGTLRMAWVSGAGLWNPPVQLGPPGLFPPGAGIAASLEFGGVGLDMFIVDRHGALNVARRWVDVGDPGLLAGRIAISPAYSFPPGAPLAVSPQFGIADQMDVFAVDRHGAMNVAWLVKGGTWNAPIAISGAGIYPRKAAVAASNQFGLPDQTDVFAIDCEGTLNVMWVTAGGAWNGPLRIGPKGLFPPGAPLVASNQFGSPDQTDVFAVDCDGALTVSWVVGAGPWNGPVRISHPHVFPPGAQLAVSNQFGLPDQTDVFGVGTNGGIQVFWVVGSGAWNGPLQVSPSCMFSRGAALAAANQAGIPDQTDVFAVTRYHALDVAWVVDAGTWHAPMQIGPAVYPVITLKLVETAGRFVEVIGKRFTPHAHVTVDFNFRGNGPSQQIGQDLIMTDAKGSFVHAIPLAFPGTVDWTVVKATDLASGAIGNQSIYY